MAYKAPKGFRGRKVIKDHKEFKALKAIQGTQGVQGIAGTPGAAGGPGNQWTEYASASTSLLNTQSQRVQATPVDLREDIEEQFTVSSWVQSSTTPTHVLEYKANQFERVTATAYPLGGGGTSVATWHVYSASAGVQDLGTARITSTRWIVEVKTTFPELTRTYEIIVEMSPLQNGISSLFVVFSKRI